MNMWSYLKVRRCFRDFVASIPSQMASFSAWGSSLLELTRLSYLGSVSSDRRWAPSGGLAKRGDDRRQNAIFERL